MNPNPQVLRGAQTNTQVNQPLGTTQPQQQTAPQNPLNNLAALAARFSGNANGQGTNSNLYNFAGNKSGHMTGLFAMDESMAEEQMKTQALTEGGQYAGSIANILLRRSGKHPFYHSLQAAMDRFKTPIKGGNQEQGFVDFVNELNFNQALYNFVCLQVAIQYGIEFAMLVTSGDDRIRDPSARDLQTGLLYRVACDTIWMQYFDWISNNPEGTQLFHRLSQRARESAIKNDQIIPEMIMQRYTWGLQQCPWRGGRIAEMQGRQQAGSPILDVVTPTDLGFGGSFHNPNSLFGDNGGNQENIDVEGTREMWAYIHRKASAKMQDMQQGAGFAHAVDAPPAVIYSNYDKPELRLSDITVENRHQYSLNDYGVQVPGTDWWIIKNENMAYIGRVLRLPDGSTLRLLDTRCVGTVPVYRINWHSGSLEYKLIPHKLQMVDVMEALISDPSKLLPYMYEEDGIQKTTFDLNVMETNKFINDGKIIPVGELKELERQPNMLIASKAADLTRENDQVMGIMTTLVKQHDPKNKLDAFVLPTLLNRDFKMEDDTNMDSFYESFGRMVKGGNEGIKDTGRILRSIRVALNDYQDTEFAGFVVPYVTNLFNRFLVECRGYHETRDDFNAANGEGCYLRSKHVFDDLEEIIELLGEKDPATLAAFMSFETNEFFRDNLEILLPREKAQSKLEALFGKEDPELLPALKANADKTIVMTRETVIIEVKKQVPPRQCEQVILKASGNPMFFAVVKEALKKSAKHFGPTPQVLIRFHNDTDRKIWVATPSDFDPQHVIHLRAVDQVCNLVHPYPVVS
ncbi:hypothetical protein pETSU_065 [Edwardsiella phage pEt-SU]|uniref:Uncharacterized protein n=1 Tax=Edwardsiella phage pEt-SU TaxID=2562142 RepID=A0A4D6DXU4_9CAUD|nr:hypothetical protein HOV39_gp065 [Edwardsiella phage pEt-SU]QBZ70646.1 hypothetical protein pETSU_065 [Edwardsiella phage pEt-SU]